LANSTRIGNFLVVYKSICAVAYNKAESLSAFSALMLLFGQ